MSEEKLDYLIEQMKEHRQETKDWKKKIEERLQKNEEQLFLYKTWIRTIRWVGGLVVLILTLKFGDIGQYFKGSP